MSPPNGSAVTHAKSPPPPQAKTSSSSGAMTPQRPSGPSNNYASLNTPIASAKRPKTKKSYADYAATNNNNAAPKTPNDAIAGGSGSRESSGSALLSPMHNVRAVPRDSHHVHENDNVDDVPIAEHDVNACESKLSIQTETMELDLSHDRADGIHGGGGGDSPSSSASWVGRKVDAIFSPVLRVLLGATNDDDGAAAAARDGGNGIGRPPAKNLEEELGSLTRTEDSDDAANDDGAVSSNDIAVDEALRRAASEKSAAAAAAPAGGDGDVTMADSYDRPRPSSSSHPGEIDDNAPAPDAQYEYQTNDHRVAAPAAADERAPEEDYDDEEEEFNPYLFIKCLPPYRYAIPPGWTSRPKALPPRESAERQPVPPVCLVLDLDETLVHCTVEPIDDADMVFPVEFNGTEYRVHVRCRPFLVEFLEAVSRTFEVVIFTASQQVYADKLLDKIDPRGKYIHHRMFRDSCLPVEGNFLKDLTVLGRDLSKTVLVDNSPHAFGYQVDNGVPIESWFDDPNDRELLKLEMFLRTLHGAEDVRDVVRNTFRTHQLILDA